MRAQSGTWNRSPASSPLASGFRPADRERPLAEIHSFFTGIVKEVGDDIVKPLGFPADNIDKVFFIFFERHKTSQFFDRASHSRQRLPNFMGDGGGKPPQGGHTLLGCDFLLESAKIRQVLKIENVAVAFRIARAQRRNADA